MLPRGVVGTRSPFYVISQRCVELDAPRLRLVLEDEDALRDQRVIHGVGVTGELQFLYFARSVVAALGNGQILASFARVKDKLKIKKIANAAAIIVGRR